MCWGLESGGCLARDVQLLKVEHHAALRVQLGQQDALPTKGELRHRKEAAGRAGAAVALCEGRASGCVRRLVARTVGCIIGACAVLTAEVLLGPKGRLCECGVAGAAGACSRVPPQILATGYATSKTRRASARGGGWT